MTTNCNHADEKAVEELFPCYEPNDIGECSPGGDHFKDCPANAAFRRRALALAAEMKKREGFGGQP